MPHDAAVCPNCVRRVGHAHRVRHARKQTDIGPSPFVQCRTWDCGHFVSAREAVCPNCGADNPALAARPGLRDALAERLDSQGFTLTAMFLAMFVAILLAALALGDTKTLALVVAPAAFVSMLVAWGALRLMRKLLDSFSAARAPTPPGLLRQSEQTIMQRLVEMKQREQQIEAVLARTGREGGGRLAGVREALGHARQTLALQHARYGLKLVEIEAARWQNKLAPLIYNLDELNFEQNENRLRAVEAARKEGGLIRSKAAKYRPALGATGEVEDFERRVDETLQSCEKIHEALVGRQAELALRGLSPLQDALHDAGQLTPPTTGGIDVFNIQVSITDFSSSFDELEAEYRRVRDEADLFVNRE